MHQRHQRLTEQLDGLQARRQRERANHAHLQRLVLTASTTCLLVISCKSRCTAGKVRRKARIARGRIEVNGADEVNPTLSSPISPCSARRATSTDLSTCASVRRVEKQPARVGQRHAPVGPIEQPYAEFLFQRLDLLAQRRL